MDLIKYTTPLNTRRAVLSDWRYFKQWYKIKFSNRPDLPVDETILVQFILDHLDGLDHDIDRQMVEARVKKQTGPIKADTLRRKMVGINFFHESNGHASATKNRSVKKALTAVKRRELERGASVVRSAAIVKKVLKDFLATINRRTVEGKRDSAILVFGFYFGGRRRSEIAGARRALFQKTAWNTFAYTLDRSKTDQTGKGLRIEVNKRNLKPLLQWIKLIPENGPLFRLIDRQGSITDRPIYPEIVNNIIKRCAASCGYDPSQYSAHGLRRGFITECGMQNIGIEQVMPMTGHKDLKTVLIYYEQGKMTHNKAGNL